MTFGSIFSQMQSLGLWAFPISADGHKRPLVKWKDYQYRPPTVGELALWCCRFASAGGGLPTGAVPGIFVVDADDAEAVTWLEDSGMPATWTVLTRRGRHYYFSWPDFDVRNSTQKVATHVDVRGCGGFVVTPGSLGKAGFVYHWAPDRSPDDVQLAAGPEWLLKLLRPKPTPAAVMRPVPITRSANTAEIADALRFIDADSRENWLRVGMALHHQFSGSESGRSLWDEWSQRSTKYNERDQRQTWKHFHSGGNQSGAVTLGPVFKMAGDRGWLAA